MRSIGGKNGNAPYGMIQDWFIQIYAFYRQRSGPWISLTGRHRSSIVSE
jgi:hypothetical protein